MPNPDGNSLDARARALLIEFLDDSRQDAAADFEALCASHPAHAEELRRLYGATLRLRKRYAFFESQTDGDQPTESNDAAGADDTIGDFRLISRIGRGGQGEVWAAEQVSMRRHVALKLVLPGRLNDKALALFAREARAGGKLNHPNIVAVYGFGEDDGRHWIAQELIEGAWTLRDSIDETRRLSELPEHYYAFVARFLESLASALQTAHDAGIIHRDVKPQNVLITKDNQPKLTDFGLARITDETALSTSGDFAGTWLYASPEQAAASRTEIDHRTDIFSLGVVMYEMLALVRPFDGDTTRQIAEKILNLEPPDLLKIRSRVPRDLAVICGKALEKRKSDRYASMAAFEADLRHWLGHEPIEAKPPTALDRAVKWCKRNPTKSVTVAMASAALVVISYLLIVNVRANRSLLAQTALAMDNQARADREAESATRRSKEVLRLSALQKLDDLLAEVTGLAPLHPERITSYEDWLQRATQLVSELPKHEAKLAELREQRSENDSIEARWWELQLTKLIEALHDMQAQLLEPETITPTYGWSVTKRLSFAKSIKQLSIESPEAARAWAQATAAIASSPIYEQLELPPQMGLLPIGPDPISGLWEFWHIASGDEPQRRPDGTLEFTAESGIVLVLLPGGEFLVGAQRENSSEKNYDPNAHVGVDPPRPASLSPFFISKFELTVAQWERLRGADPSYNDYRTYSSLSEPSFSAMSAKCPVTDVSQNAARNAMLQVGLDLPSEMQWEYAARAGTTTAWWTGNDPAALFDAENLRDLTAYQYIENEFPDPEPWEDGYILVCDVDALRGNPFGLYHVHGNVREWTRSTDRSYPKQRIPNDWDPHEGDRYVARGGSYGRKASGSSSAKRNAERGGHPSMIAGFRPSRELER